MDFVFLINIHIAVNVCILNRLVSVFCLIVRRVVSEREREREHEINKLNETEKER